MKYVITGILLITFFASLSNSIQEEDGEHGAIILTFTLILAIFWGGIWAFNNVPDFVRYKLNHVKYDDAVITVADKKVTCTEIKSGKEIFSAEVSDDYNISGQPFIKYSESDYGNTSANLYIPITLNYECKDHDCPKIPKEHFLSIGLSYGGHYVESSDRVNNIPTLDYVHYGYGESEFTIEDNSCGTDTCMREARKHGTSQTFIGYALEWTFTLPEGNVKEDIQDDESLYVLSTANVFYIVKYGEGEEILRSDNEIISMHKDGGKIYLVDSTGCIYVVNTIDKEIKSTKSLNLSLKSSVLGDGHIYLTDVNNNIYKYDLDDKTIHKSLKIVNDTLTYDDCKNNKNIYSKELKFDPGYSPLCVPKMQYGKSITKYEVF